MSPTSSSARPDSLSNRDFAHAAASGPAGELMPELAVLRGQPAIALIGGF